MRSSAPARGADVLDAATVEGRQYHGAPADWSVRLVLKDRRPQFEVIEPLAGPNIYSDWLRSRGEGSSRPGLPEPAFRR